MCPGAEDVILCMLYVSGSDEAGAGSPEVTAVSGGEAVLSGTGAGSEEDGGGVATVELMI